MAWENSGLVVHRMAWEQRGKHRYFYQSRRINGKPRRMYMGCGHVGELNARLHDRARRQRQTEDQAWQVEQVQLARADAVMNELRTLADLIARAKLLLAGFYEHHGEWRRRG
jgi:hypothetical protein